MISTIRDYSLSFNHLYRDNYIRRSSLLDELEELASGDTILTIVEGKEGIGKTNLLLEFASKHNQNCFAYFINPACSITYKQDYLMEDVGKQILFKLDPLTIEDVPVINESTFKTLLFNLIRRPLKKGNPIFIVLDGLDQIDSSDLELIKPIVHDLPWGTNNYYFIVSGDANKLKAILPTLAFKKSASIRVTRFSEDETVRFFTPFNDAENDLIKEIHKTWAGHPERLSQIKRIVDGGCSLTDFMNQNHSHKDELLELEWQQAKIDVKDFSNTITKCISILAFDDMSSSLNTLASVVQIENELLKNLLSELSFIVIKNDEVGFISSSFRKFAIERLKRHEPNALNLLITFNSNKEDLNSMMSLPPLFEKNEEWGKIVTLLNIENLTLITSNSKSFSDLKLYLNIGYKASANLKKAFEHVFRFSLFRSTVFGLQISDNDAVRIEAYVANDKQDAVFSLISAAVLKEDKLQMLILFAKACRVHKKNIEQIVIDEVETLLVGLDNEYLRENIVDITTGLAYFLPNLAVQTLERASGLKEKSGSLEWLMGYIAHIISNNHISNDPEQVKTDSQISTETNSFLENFAKSIGVGVGDIKHDEILDFLLKVENISDRIYMLRSWIKKNKSAPNVIDIVKFGLDNLLLDSSNIKPTTTILLDIVTPLSDATNSDSTTQLISRIDDLIKTIDTPTIDRIRIELILIKQIIRYDIDIANDRFVDLYGKITKNEDISIVLEAKSECWNLIKYISEDKFIKIEDFIIDRNFVKDEINLSIDTLLKGTAEQFDEIENTLKIISKIDISYAVSLSMRLNTFDRRVRALNRCLNTYIIQNIKGWKLEEIKHILDHISSNSAYNASITEVFDQAFEQFQDDKHNAQVIAGLVPMINKTIGYGIKCYLLSKAIRMLGVKVQLEKGLINYDKLIAISTGFIDQYWTKIDDPIHKVKTALDISTTLSSYKSDYAENYLHLAEKVSSQCTIPSGSHAVSYIHCIRLMIRIYAGLVKTQKYRYEKISSLIDYVPSDIDKVTLFGEIAVRSYIKGAIDICGDVVSTKIIPIVETYKKTDSNVYLKLVLRVSASAIYLAQPETLNLLLTGLSDKEIEEIVSPIIVVLITKTYDDDPYDDVKGTPNFNYSDAVKVINLLEKISTDSELYRHIYKLSNICRYYPNSFLRDQKGDLKQKLENLVARKLPNLDTGLAHEGYLVACLACIQIFNIDQNEVNRVFEDLQKRTPMIDNISDRALVFSILGQTAPEKQRKQRIEYYHLAFAEADKIPSIEEKINRYEGALDGVRKISLDLFTEKVNNIQTEVYKLDDSNIFPTFRRLIDLTFKSSDKALTQRIISNFDSDPGRSRLAEPATEHYDKLQLEKEVLHDYSKFGQIKNRRQMSNIAWRMLGQLNATVRNSREVEQTVKMLYSASRMPFMYSAPLFHFFIENCIANDSKNETLLLSFYESAYANARLALSISGKTQNRSMSDPFKSSSTGADGIVVMPGERDKAMSYIKVFVKGIETKKIYIIDPYFSFKDLDVVKSLSQWSYGAEITVLTSCDQILEFSKSAYWEAWEKISSEDPPLLHLIKACDNNKSPFHDRYLIFDESDHGLFLGTSFGATGIGKISKISTVDTNTLKSSIVEPLILHRLRHLGKFMNIKYESFDL